MSAADPARAPRRGLGLVNQYGLLLLAALLASHLIAMLLIQRTGAIVHPISREQAMLTLSRSHALATVAPEAALRSGVIDTQGPHDPATAATRLWLSATPEVPAYRMDPMETDMVGELRRRSDLHGAPAWFQLERVSGSDARVWPLSLAAWEPLRLRASLALPDGRWLNAIVAMQGRYDWTQLLTYALPASILPVVALAWLLGWRLARPLRTLSEAAARVRYGQPLPTLALDGPRETRELIHQFNSMQQRIARHRDARTRMLAAISHDLRTPVAELRVQLELVGDDALRGDLRASVGELQALVESTLDFAKADTATETRTWTRIDTLVQSLALRYAHLGTPIRTDPERLRGLGWHVAPFALKRALTNLIDNALVHAPAPALEIHVQRRTLVMRVLDDGPGIAEDRITAVFDPFFQLDEARGPQRAGAGLGLSIAKACIEAQGGQLTLSNRGGGGLCAWIVIPE